MFEFLHTLKNKIHHEKSFNLTYKKMTNNNFTDYTIIIYYYNDNDYYIEY